MRAGRPCTGSLCRGCCCGTRRKHPDTDHAWQLERLLAAARTCGGQVEVRATECLDYCAAGNIIVINPSGVGRAHGAKPVWLGFVLDDARLEPIIDWVLAGGPGVAPIPPKVDLLVVSPPVEERRARAKRARRS
ncbi:MAG: (2Fe-2S) ferredoxin domain-containing protein [Sporichthyaceae bacterium]